MYIDDRDYGLGVSEFGALLSAWRLSSWVLGWLFDGRSLLLMIIRR